MEGMASLQLTDGTPRVALAVRDTDDPAAVLAAGADIVELRIDQFQQHGLPYVEGVLDRYAAMPRLATIRFAREGGAWAGAEEERADLFEGVLPHAEAVDVEIGAESIFGRVVAAGRAAGKIVIASHHDFEKTPGLAGLCAKADAARAAGADLVKVAATCNEPEDVRRLARFLLAQEGRPAIVIGMGAHGTATRLLFPALGSRITYTFLGEPTAPGQLNCTLTLQYLSVLYPNSRGKLER